MHTHTHTTHTLTHTRLCVRDELVVEAPAAGVQVLNCLALLVQKYTYGRKLLALLVQKYTY